MPEDRKLKDAARRLAAQKSISYAHALRLITGSRLQPLMHSQSLWRHSERSETLTWVLGTLRSDRSAPYALPITHTLIAGPSGSGKSVLLHSLIAQLLLNYGDRLGDLILIEPKNELQVWGGHGRLYDSWRADGVEMAENYDLFSAVSTLLEYFKSELPLRTLSSPPIVVVIEVVDAFYYRTVRQETVSATGQVKARHIKAVPEVAELFRDPKVLSAYAAANIHFIFTTAQSLMDMNPEVSLTVVRVASENYPGKGRLTVIKDGKLDEVHGFWVVDGDSEEGEQNDVIQVLTEIEVA